MIRDQHDIGRDTGPGFGLYVHWPFCLVKCPYCDFNSHVRDKIDQKRWRDAFLSELDDLAENLALTGPGRLAGTDAAPRQLDSIFFGGGTPSLMDPETSAAIIERAKSLWPGANDPEITLEANPTSVEIDRLAAYADAGVNRVSLGVQSLRDDALKFLGRAHDAKSARNAVEAAAHHFPRFNFDLIYARPGQSAADWRAELSEALSFAGRHLSVYQLTIEPGTAFHTRHRQGAFEMPDESLSETLFDMTQDLLGDAGLPAYEISNHAAPGEESRHNLIYWMSGDWAGIGPGAHGRLTGADGLRRAQKRYRLPEKWLEQVGIAGHGQEEDEALSPLDALEEFLMMGLRVGVGLDQDRLRTYLDQADATEAFADRKAPLLEEGLLEITEGRLRATTEGAKRLNAVISHLLT